MSRPNHDHLITLTGKVCRVPFSGSGIAVCILPDDASGGAPLLVAGDTLGQELRLFRGDRLTVTGRRLRHRPSRNTIQVTSYGFFNHARP